MHYLGCEKISKNLTGMVALPFVSFQRKKNAFNLAIKSWLRFLITLFGLLKVSSNWVNASEVVKRNPSLVPPNFD